MVDTREPDESNLRVTALSFISLNRENEFLKQQLARMEDTCRECPYRLTRKKRKRKTQNALRADRSDNG